MDALEYILWSLLGAKYFNLKKKIEAEIYSVKINEKVLRGWIITIKYLLLYSDENKMIIKI